MSAAEQVAFTVHPAILETVIAAQSGTLHKALLELVMNSIDANATNISVTVSEDSFEVVDNGDGFSNEQQIRQCFAPFGAPQTTEKTYGRFRIGRGQSFVWGVVTWRSGPFKMVVDTRNKGLHFDLFRNEEPVKGCIVSGKLYDLLERYDLSQEIRRLDAAVKYIHVPLVLNGQICNTNPIDKKWSHETPDAYIEINTSRYSQLNVYNQGVLCYSLPYRAYGIAGIIVSKSPLTVNFARNDILLKNCETWKRIARFLKKIGVDTLLNSDFLHESEKDSIATRFMSGEFSYLQVRKTPFLTDSGGASLSFEQLLKERQVTLSNGSIIADHVQTSRMARVLHQCTMARFESDNLRSFKMMLLDAIDRDYAESEDESPEEKILCQDCDRINQITWVSNINHYKKYFNGGFIVLQDKDLTAIERTVLEAMRYGDLYIRRALHNSRAAAEEPLPRNILAGDSDSEAWTDGISFICLNRRLLKKGAGGVERFLYLTKLLSHEYLHGSGDCEQHTHGGSFYEAFHRASLFMARRRNMEDLYSAAKKISAKYVQLTQKAGRPVPVQFSQFGGIPVDRYEKLERSSLKLEKTLWKLREGPIVEDPEILIFWSGIYAGIEFKGKISFNGPYLEVKGRKFSWEYLSLELCENVLPEMTDDEANRLCNDIGITLWRKHNRDGDDNQLTDIPFLQTNAGIMFRQWAIKHPVLAKHCQEYALWGKEWFSDSSTASPSICPTT